ncbi:uncharacterized protein [Antedon mediterranea]|uniref:uncharacterized protein n=1 Tax=Antedon mediterranea TaxID=105859 RepID=UPI003AF685E1
MNCDLIIVNLILFVTCVTQVCGQTMTEMSTTEMSTTEMSTTEMSTTEMSTTEMSTTDAITTGLTDAITTDPTDAITTSLTTDATPGVVTTGPTDAITTGPTDAITTGSTDAITTGSTDAITTGPTTEMRTVITTPAPSDTKAVGLTITNPSSDLDFYVDADEYVTYTIQITNDGGTDIEEASSGDNWSFKIVLSGSDDPTADDATTLEFVTDLSDANNTDAGISAGGSISVTGVVSVINVPEANADCYDFEYTCVVITNENSNNTDAVTTNNHYCVELGDLSDSKTGNLKCRGFVSQISLVVLALSFIVSRFI